MYLKLVESKGQHFFIFSKKEGRIDNNKTVKSELISINFLVCLFYSEHSSALYVVKKAKTRKKSNIMLLLTPYASCMLTSGFTKFLIAVQQFSFTSTHTIYPNYIF